MPSVVDQDFISVGPLPTIYSISGAVADGVVGGINVHLFQVGLEGVTQPPILPPILPPQPYIISGRINPTGVATVNNLSITLLGAAPLPIRTFTNIDGVYQFSGLENGVYLVVPTVSYASMSPVNQTVTVNSDNIAGINFTITLTTTGHSINGAIRTAGGIYITGVQITAVGPITSSHPGTSASNYQIGGLVAGTYIVTPQLLGYDFVPANRIVNVNAFISGVDFIGTPI